MQMDFPFFYISLNLVKKKTDYALETSSTLFTSLFRNERSIFPTMSARWRFTVININSTIGSTVSRITSTFVWTCVICAFSCKHENSRTRTYTFTKKAISRTISSQVMDQPRFYMYYKGVRVFNRIREFLLHFLLPHSIFPTLFYCSQRFD